MPQGLTRKQAELLAWLRQWLPQAAHPPTLDAVCSALGRASRGSLHKHVQALVVAGLVEPMNGRQRGLVLTAAGQCEADAAQVAGPERGMIPESASVSVSAPGSGSGIRLRLLGRVAAGRPIEAIEGDELVEIGADWCTQAGCFALTVRGDSMIDDGIRDGDVVVVEPRAHARNGEIVIALVDGADATVKRIEQRPGAVVLHPASAAHFPLVLSPDRVTIQGVVKGLIRRY